ncbi:MAG TPA: PEGA domain-containing protein [Vicinamibacterales bacterium]|nr:PEGA domain-containing protein [Vicinamibacterales bacterium]
MLDLPFDDASGSSSPPAFGTFRVLHQTGSGVLGPVFRAWDQQRDRLVTVKAFKLDLLPEQVTAVASALRQLAAAPRPHPALVELIDAGFEGTTPFLVMECVTGDTLDIALRMVASAPLSRAIELLRPLAAAVDASWETIGGHGALHPRDVFVGEAADELRVTGAGVVAALRSAGVEVAPRRPYAAPERAGATWDRRADVYSIAAIAHELLTRRRPANGREQDGVFSPEITPPQRVAIRRVMARGLADRPDDRYATAVAFVDALAAMKVETQSALPFAAGPEFEPEMLPPVAAIDASDPRAPSEFVAETQPAVADEAEVVAEAPAAPPPVTIAEPVATVDEPVPVAESVAREATPVAETVDHPPVVDPPLAIDPPPSPWRPVDTPLPLGSLPLFGTHTTSPAATESKRRLGLRVAATVALVAGGALVYTFWRRGPTTGEIAAPTAAASAQGATDTEVKIGAGASAPHATDTSVPVAPPSAASTPAKSAAARPAQASPAGRRSNDATPVALASGKIVVRSSPAGAMVTIDGRMYDNTPVTVRDLPVGTHVVQVARPGFVPRSERVTLTPTAPESTLTLTLAPGLSQTGDSRPAAPAGRAMTSAAGTGALDIDVQPRGARVIIDGERRGVTPMRISEIKAGVHTVTIERDGYRPSTTNVTVESGKRAAVKLTLIPIRKP